MVPVNITSLVRMESANWPGRRIVILTSDKEMWVKSYSCLATLADCNPARLVKDKDDAGPLAPCLHDIL